MPDLTPEEENELAELEALESGGEQLNQMQVGGGELSPEEEAELAQLESIESEIESTGAAESIIRGAAQGITLGFSDEAEGMVGAGIRQLRGDNTPFSEAYQQERDLARFENEKAELANPILSGISMFVGGATPMLLGGTALAGYRAAASIGGLSGLGFSNAKGSELVQDVAIGTALGLGGEAVFKGVGKAIGKLVSKSEVPTVQALDIIGETRHPSNVSFETNIYKQALKGGFKDMDAFFTSPEAQKTAAVWASEAHNIPKDLLKFRKDAANLKLRNVMSAPENSNVKVNVSDIIEELQTGDSGLKNFRNQGTQKQAVDSIEKEILSPAREGTLRLAGKKVDITNLDFEQSIEFKRLVNELTFQNADPLLDTADQFAFRKAPAVSSRLKQFSAEIMERTNQADQTGSLRDVNDDLFRIIDAEQLAPKNFKELKSLATNFGDDKAFFKGQEFLLALDNVDESIKAELAQEIVPIMTLTDAVNTARQWNVGVSTLFQAKAGAAAIGPAGALVALGKGGSLLATQAVGKAAKAAFKIPRSIAGMLENSDMLVQKIADINPALAITVNDMIHDRNIEGLKGVAEQALADPKLSTQFEEGFGFEGRVTSPEEMEQVKQQIMASDVSLFEKITMVQELESTGDIPVPRQEEVQPLNLQRPVVEEREEAKSNLNLVRKAEKELGE